MKDTVNKQNDPANDYALAKLLNEYAIKIFTPVIDYSSTPDITAVNRSYVLIVNELKQIYDRQPKLKELGNSICWRQLENLELAHEFVPAIEFVHSGGDYGEMHNSKVSSLCYIEEKTEPDLTPHPQELLEEADKNFAQFQHELDKMYATVSFQSMVIPVVTIGGTQYHLPAMREGLAYNVISFCLSKHPNQEIGIDKLKVEMKQADINIFGLSNFNNDTYKSVFGKNNPLNPFMSSSPKSIQVRKTTALTNQQIAEIAEISTKISE